MKGWVKINSPFVFPEVELIDSLEEFNELDREVWEFIEVPSRGDKLRLWSEPDARC